MHIIARGKSHTDKIKLDRQIMLLCNAAKKNVPLLTQKEKQF